MLLFLGRPSCVVDEDKGVGVGETPSMRHWEYHGAALAGGGTHPGKFEGPQDGSPVEEGFGLPPSFLTTPLSPSLSLTLTHTHTHQTRTPVCVFDASHG